MPAQGCGSERGYNRGVAEGSRRWAARRSLRAPGDPGLPPARAAPEFAAWTLAMRGESHARPAARTRRAALTRRGRSVGAGSRAAGGTAARAGEWTAPGCSGRLTAPATTGATTEPKRVEG